MELKWAVAAMTGTLSAALCIWLAAIFIKWLSSLDWTFESASRCAGRYGEEIAAEIIRRVLREDDCLPTNIGIAYLEYCHMLPERYSLGVMPYDLRKTFPK